MIEKWYDDPRMTSLDSMIAALDNANVDSDVYRSQLLNAIGYRMAVALGEVQPDHVWEGIVAELAGRFFTRVARHEKQRAQVLAALELHELPDPEGHRKDWSRIWPSEIRELLTDEETPR